MGVAPEAQAEAENTKAKQDALPAHRSRPQNAIAGGHRQTIGSAAGRAERLLALSERTWPLSERTNTEIRRRNSCCRLSQNGWRRSSRSPTVRTVKSRNVGPRTAPRRGWTTNGQAADAGRNRRSGGAQLGCRHVAAHDEEHHRGIRAPLSARVRARSTAVLRSGCPHDAGGVVQQVAARLTAERTGLLGQDVQVALFSDGLAANGRGCH
jgi:hypothetical protein